MSFSTLFSCELKSRKFWLALRSGYCSASTLKFGMLFEILAFILLNYVYFMYSESNDSLQENILTFLNFAQVNIKVFFEIPIFGLSSISLLLTIFLIYINIFEFFINLFPIKTTDGYLILKRFRDNIISENLNSELRESLISK